MKTNTKQFPNDQLFDIEVLKHTRKGLGKNNLPPNLLKMAAFTFTPGVGPHAPFVLYCLYDRSSQQMQFTPSHELIGFIRTNNCIKQSHRGDGA